MHFDHDEVYARRVLLRLSQAECARRVGWSRQRWSAIEAGTYEPQPETVKLVASALGCDPTDLMSSVPFD